MANRVLFSLAVAIALGGLMSTPIEAQGPSFATPQQLDFDRPESWAMKYFTSLSIMSRSAASGDLDVGSIHLELEGGIVPTLGAEKRRVGFVGSKVEDLNRTPVFGRLRATVGLPGRFKLTAGVTPPVEVDGVTPRLWSLALARPVFDGRLVRLELRLHAQAGTLEGDLTCPKGIAGLDDPVLNPDVCLAASSDEVTQDYAGLEFAVMPRLWGDRWDPYLAVSLNRMDLAFQVRAPLERFFDLDRLETEGSTYSLSVGTAYRFREKVGVVMELFYAPLDVVRDVRRGAQTDELVNGRLALSYKLR